MARKPFVCSILLALAFSLAACNKSTPSAANQTPPPSDAAAQSPTPSQNQTPGPADAASSQTPPTPASPQATPPPPPPIIVPAGTTITVSLGTPVSSKTSQVGDPFEASVAEPIVVKGKVVVPKGASAAGTVTEAHAAGKFKGGATLNLSLKHLVIRGKPYSIQTVVLTQESKGKGKRTAGMIGGGTAGGALIGGLAGGGKGAAIGALVGAGAGTAGAGLTGNNRDITLPVETAVSFKLSASIKVPQPSPKPEEQPQ